MKNVNKQLLDAAKILLALHDSEVFVADPWNKTMEEMRQAIAAAEQAQQVCRDCNGTGDRDSGGVHPWGEAIMVQCDCRAMQAICAGMTLEEMQNAPFTYKALLEIVQRRDVRESLTARPEGG